MTDLVAIKARLSNPREVAAILGLHAKPIRNGVVTRCPVHGNKSGSLGLRVGPDGTIQAFCFGCGLSGDVLTLLAAIEGDFKRGLARAIEMAGGAGLNGRYATPAYKEPERCDSDVYHELATRILDAGRLNGRPWTREVGEYLERRGLLEFAYTDQWAALPSLGWLLDIARGVCENMATTAHSGGFTLGSSAGHVSAVFSISSRSLLIAAKLAKINKRGEFVAAWKGWNLVIPWRGPDGRINALQRRRTWTWTKRGPDDTEPAKYVLPWAPEWPYGSERVGYVSSDCDHSRNERMGKGSQALAPAMAERLRVGKLGSDESNALECDRGRADSPVGIAIVEGAVDVLAMRALYPAFVALGIPGIGSWRASWAALVDGCRLRVALDRGKPGPDGIVPEDRAAARIALDCAGRGRETDRVLEWWLSRWRRGRALGCVLCGAGEAWLCGGCGRRRAPKGSDWGGLWEARLIQPLRRA